MILSDNYQSLVWDVYSGPSLIEFELDSLNSFSDDWGRKPCSVQELATYLHKTSESIVCLHGRAKLRPRALGNRSILAAPICDMKSKLDAVKDGEGYRPVAPICLEEDVSEVFTLGTPDSYMLIEHIVKDEWQNKVPAKLTFSGTKWYS